MEIILHGDTPSKKNSRNIFSQGGRIFNLPSKHYKDWHEGGILEVMTQCKVKEPLARAAVSIVFYPKTKRRADLTNKAESVMDLLVDCGVLQDDNWFVACDIHLLFGGVDNKNPRAEVSITTF